VSTPGRARWSWLLEGAALVFCILLVGATALGSKLNHNEQMYLAAARLWSDLRLYTDYAYLQAPLLPILNAALFGLWDHERMLLVARLHVAAWAIIAIAGIYELGRRLSRGSRAIGIAAALAVCTHPMFLKSASESSNYMLPLALTVLSLLALIARGDTTSGMVVSGVTFGLAVASKSFYLPLALGWLAIAWTDGGRSKIGWWLLAALVGSLPIFYYLARDPAAFFFGNLGYHIANSDWRRDVGSRMAMTLPSKLAYLAAHFRDFYTFSLSIFCAAGYALSRLRRFRGLNDVRSPHLFYCSTALLGLACAIVLTPTPVFAQYFAIPCVFLALAAITCAGLLPERQRLALVALCLVAVAAAPATWRLPRMLRANSVPARVEREARRLGAHLDCEGHAYVATLAPILPLEAGCRIYPELATGVFGHRVADRHSTPEQDELEIVGAQSLPAFLDARRPPAILVGFEPRHDRPFESYARERGYTQLAETIMGRGRLWLLPDSVARTRPARRE
jgi:hypothetical protein